VPHRTEIAGIVTKLMAHYWLPDEPTELREMVGSDWIEDLEQFDLAVVEESCREYRRGDTFRIRPLPNDIRKLCIENQRLAKFSGRLLPKPERVEPPPSIDGDELVREGRAIGNKWAQDRGFVDLDAYAAAHGLGYAAVRAAVCRSILGANQNSMPLHPDEVMSPADKERVRRESLESSATEEVTHGTG
jgi:hypothetical protein